MERQNITLSIPKHVLKKAKLLAVKQGVSISALLTQALEDVVEDDEGYRSAQRRHLKLLDKGLDLGTKGRAGWSRDVLHAR
jgi:hypothetical protein